MNDRVRLHPSWRERLAPELSSPGMAALRAFLVNEKAAGKAIYPPGPLIFNALDRTPFEAVKVVILGQDPYHGPGQAHGLSFSVPRGVAIPPSLVNIYAEIQRDLGIALPRHGNLEAWAERGVLLLNSVLTVEAGQAASHQGRGWEAFTDRIVALLAAEREHLVFLLWGSHAQRKAAMVDPQRHLLLKAPHPSPLSAHRGFLGCGHFSACNDYLHGHGLAPIDWSLPA
ncbi:MAG: uracil-DNA glycosylase [Xanthomonadales bacterium]|jgi:uracil-DNA glycosylase|nr:uracil-DNA glycosylase [Xanthomonadales bacterium]